MNIQDTVIMGVIGWVVELIDNIDFSILKGLAYIALFLVSAYLVIYVWLWQSFFASGFTFPGNWKRGLIILGLWLLIELSNWIGGGHQTTNKMRK